MSFGLPSLSLPRVLEIGAIAILVLGGFIAILRVGLLPTNPVAGVAVVYAPWTTPDQVVARSVGAGARFVRFGGFHLIAVVMPDGPDYVNRVLADFALLAVDPQALAACLPDSFLKQGNAL
jgi:hypothetical protein